MTAPIDAEALACIQEPYSVKYRINPYPSFRAYDRLVVYRKNSKWNLYTFTEGYPLLARDKNELVKWVCKTKKVKPEDVKFLKCKVIVGEEV